MLALVAVNLLGAVVFAGVYAAGSAGRITPALLLSALVLAFLALTALWVRVERRSHVVDPIRRLGRGLVGLLAVVIGLPAAVLMPLFWLENQLPPEAVGELHLGPTMVLLLAGLAMVALMNVAGGLVAVAIDVRRRWRTSDAP